MGQNPPKRRRWLSLSWKEDEREKKIIFPTDPSLAYPVVKVIELDFLLFLFLFDSIHRNWSWRKGAKHLKCGGNHLWSPRWRFTFSMWRIHASSCAERSRSFAKSVPTFTGKSGHLHLDRMFLAVENSFLLFEKRERKTSFSIVRNQGFLLLIYDWLAIVSLPGLWMV